ncbi:ATP-dependent helicase [Corynebacterium caspium]|uniref:ATP-dependent helicase n=1 Tax=Corynebacterium caspium TaxID=234828 RepID=UPI000371FF4F|nr:ATP-dependent helicase [Corynebacterium caspium]WKD59644.1 putative ATP-dependent helicase Lhr [Corynebacterium caspium DSM 44850]
MSAFILDRFHTPVSQWFKDVFATPTQVQEQAWDVISQGDNALVVAPTGSGKTLAAFLWSLNKLTQTQTSGPTLFPDHPSMGKKGSEKRHGVKILYISPLKALGVDVEHNLRAPLTGISRTAQRLGLEIPEITVGVRSGDTTAAERSRLVRNPPDILITTPESAYLMLTSKAASILSQVDTVIIDEIHALAGTKRGVHLALSLERLAHIAGDFQRIGLSATVRPPATVAGFLGGNRPVKIINPPIAKQWDLQVRVPVPDMTDLPDPPDVTSGASASATAIATATSGKFEDPAGIFESALPSQNSIWPFIEQSLYQEIMAVRSTLIFVNSRRTAERLTSRINELYALENDPESLAPATRRDPAQLMKSVDTAGHAPALIARAHHGSVSKEERARTEQGLKEGALKAVIATSSLELGIDMGAVDLVVQIAAPPAVAAGLQRVGRAGHAVGAVSKGSFYPNHRSDLLATTVILQRMGQGLIEEIKIPKNPLDVLLQQTVAAVAVADWEVDAWFATVRKAYPYRDLTRPVFDAVIDLAAGAYPSTDFADLRPRIVFDRIAGVLSARPGAQRVAVTSGGTIPDRGMFGVFLVGGEAGARRVGELDEEMVYESRPGDIFTLGASSWRIEEITRDQVLVSPAPGHTGRLPFWTGEQAGRPAELGKALGALSRELLALSPAAATAKLQKLGLDEWACDNLCAYLLAQREATGIVPDESTFLLERFRDELGDWRLILHSPLGRGVNAAWALAVGARIAERTGIDAQAVAGDDGIILRLPEGETEPGAELFIFEAAEITEIVTKQVSNSALFAARFRECAARALLLPRRDPGKRAPLWQQRQKAAQLLDIARKYPDFPIILETVRECLQDVYDLPALENLCQDIALHKIRIAEVTTTQPSPFAASLLFGYTGAFIYEGDTPLAEKRAAALALDPSLLAQLLGTVELRELFDPEIIATVHAQLQYIAPERRARNTEELADQLRILGPIPVAELAEHISFAGSPVALAQQELGHRIMQVRINGEPYLAQQEDAAILRDALGIPIPPGVFAPANPITDALSQLLNRWTRTRGPFLLSELAEAFHLAISVAHNYLQGAISAGDIIEGHFRAGITETEYCAAPVLNRIRRQSLAALRANIQPVSAAALGRFSPEWQQVAAIDESPVLSGIDGTYAALEQLAGVRLPASAWETLVLKQRVADYQPHFLDELCANGEILVVGDGSAGATDPWVYLLPPEFAAELLPEFEKPSLSPLQAAILDIFESGGAYLFSDILEKLQMPAGAAEATGATGTTGTTGAAGVAEVRTAIWDLFQLGLLSPDGFSRVRARLGMAKTSAHRVKRQPTRGRLRLGRSSFMAPRAHIPPDIAGRWALVPRQQIPSVERSIALGEALLDRYGLLSRGTVQAENILGGFARIYKVLSGFEENGKTLRGYFVAELGAAQFSTPAVVDRLRALNDSPDISGWPSGTKHPKTYVLAAADPANPYGSTLPWPISGPTRTAGAIIVLADGLFLGYATRGGRNLIFPAELLPDAAELTQPPIVVLVKALKAAIRRGLMEPFVVEKINGEAALTHPLRDLMVEAGLRIVPQGLKFSGSIAKESPNATPRGRNLATAIAELAAPEDGLSDAFSAASNTEYIDKTPGDSGESVSEDIGGSPFRPRGK